ncbi:hypothetical protein SAMN04490243_2813 [Robiginitalea myxolifaciens]|uniref:Uncharacterized protein n=1 Tax=Robiginitalea myxolifaciens TaxID=400055 RepID=A0A1I6HJ96_9FLAO|nr:hypothetical protein [Robiginitalea myxolifaciens]SFR54543.1 hypothetical protein SAMN04490243_2813 [Robiginitalea myxolifaciens]
MWSPKSYAQYQPIPSLHIRDFLVEAGPEILLFVIPSVAIALFYVSLFIPWNQNRQLRRWLLQNRRAVRQLLILNFTLKRLRPKLPGCSSCTAGRFELWDHDRNLLVFRCMNCRRNITVSVFQFQEVRQILNNLPGLFIVLRQLSYKPFDALGRHLQALCVETEVFARRYLRR